MGNIYFWRQIFILTATAFNCICSGIMMAFPSVLNPATLSTNITDVDTDIGVSMDEISWINTSNGIAGIFGFIVLSPLMQIFGRKIVHITDNLFLLVGWIVLALAHSTNSLIAARIIHGFDVGSFYICAMIVSEYTDPKRRGYSMAIMKMSVAVGTLVCHALSLIWNWRHIAIFTIIFPTLAIAITLFWPESPSYLAMKGRFKESEKSFIWLHGGSNLQELHLLQSSQLQKAKNTNTEKWHTFLFKKDFMKPFLIVSLLTVVLEFSGKHYFGVYVIQMMTELVEDKSLAKYVSIGADLFTIVALMSSFLIIRPLRRRTILFSFGSATVALMLILCFVIDLKSPTMSWLAPLLIVVHSFIVNISIIPVCCTLFSEIYPLEYKGWGSCLNGFLFTFLYTLLLKLTPVLMQSYGVGGVYAAYGITIAVCLLVLYFILPETKDKYLQEIENEIKCTRTVVVNNYE